MRKNGKKCSRLTRSGIVLLCVLFGLVASSCTAYNPSFYASYDVLNPGPAVRINPIGFTVPGQLIGVDGAEIPCDQSYAIINGAFTIWVNELQEEIRKLRTQSQGN